MARLIAALIRHGDYAQLPNTPSAHQPFPLNAAGEQQARDAAVLLREACVRNGWQPEPCIDTSRMLRAWQTARIIAEELADMLPTGFTLASFDALAERSVGAAANLSVAQVERIIQQDPRFPDLPEGWKSDSHIACHCRGRSHSPSLVNGWPRICASVPLQSRQRRISRD